MPIPKNCKIPFSIEHEGTTVYAHISLCSFMHDNYGLQIGLHLQPEDVNAATVFIVNKDWDNNPETARETAEQMAHKALSEGVLAEIQKKEAAWRKVDEAWKKSQVKRDRKEAKRLANMKAEGYTHQVVAWIHPEGGGDDSCVEMFTDQAPTKAMIKKLLKGSSVKTDYAVTTL